METSEVFWKKITMEQSVNNIIAYTRDTYFNWKAKELIDNLQN